MIFEETNQRAEGNPSQHLCVAVIFVGRSILSGGNNSLPNNSFNAKPMKGKKTKNKSLSRHICSSKSENVCILDTRLKIF